MEIELFINMPSGLVALDGESEGIFLPEGPFAGAPRITYGGYLRSVARCLSSHSFRPLRELLERRAGPRLESATKIELIGEKHGALYSVSRLAIHFPNIVLSFAVNTAFSPEQHAFLELEYRLLRKLHKRFGSPFVPRAFLSGKTILEGTDLRIRLFIAEWFENHHEFHLSSHNSGRSGESRPIIVWNGHKAPCFLNRRKTAELYRQASSILTACLDTGSFRQIYPWHHAAGDFVIDESRDPASVRLITVRGYRSLLARKSDAEDKLLGSLHFFMNLSIRMRIDRLDGTGELAWAGPEESLAGLIRGFCESWKTKVREDEELLPQARRLFAIFLQFTPEQRLAFAEIAAGDGRIEAGEEEFVLAHLPAHVRDLSAEIEQMLGVKPDIGY